MLDSKRTAGPAGSTKPRPLREYVGSYRCGGTGWLHVDIAMDPEGRGLTIWGHGVKGPGFPLEHYERNVFSWLRPYEEAARRGHLIDWHDEYYLVTFENGPDGQVDRLTMVLDPEDVGPEVLFKQSSSASRA